MTHTSFDRFRGLPLEVQAVIDGLCTEFEQSWRAGDRPVLETYLTRVGTAHRAALLTELLALEVELRDPTGEPATAESYAERFPEFRSVVREVFAGPAAAAAPERPAVPVVPGYEVQAELGHGGMGVVYRARHQALNRLVALKMLRPDGLVTLEQRVRFRMEAEAIAALRHPSIVQVYETGEADGQPYLALEYVDGGSLDQFTGKPVPARRVAELVEPVARAVHYAHSRGIVHRDLKPANILLGHNAECGTWSAELPDPDPGSTFRTPHSAFRAPKVADFGLAQHGPTDARRTQAGVIVGTPVYMAPEQADPDGPPVGPAADVYALGVVLYELLTGAVPYKGRSSLDTLVLAKTAEPVPPRQRVASVPRDLETVVMRCLEKHPSRRYPTAEALANDLEAFLDGRPVGARPITAAERVWKWCRRRPAQAALCGLVAGLVLAVVAVSAVGIVRLNREHDDLLAEQARATRAEEDRRAALAESLLTAAPDSVPYILDALAPSAHSVQPALRTHFRSAPDPARKLRAAIGLTVLGESHGDFLIAAIPTAHAAESRNLTLALRAVRSPELLARLQTGASTAPDFAQRARYAIVLLELGDAGAAAAMLAGGADPTARTVFIDVFQTWHGDLTALPEQLRSAPAPDTLGGLCLAVGGVDPVRFSAGTRDALVAALGELYRTHPDPGPHAAAEWALRQWRAPLPELPRTRELPAGRRWFVNSLGLTMAAVPTGAFAVDSNTAILMTRPYSLSDREVSIELYRQFLADTPEVGAPQTTLSEPGRPVAMVNRTEMLLFCNWLSAKDGRSPCYTRPTGAEDWACDFAANGYRLPTEAEWDYAHRAGATAPFAFGNDPRWLSSYAHIASRRTAPGGSKRPNRWGLFDMTGNVWEVCWDQYGEWPKGLLVDPTPGGNAPWVTRGGAYDSGAYDTGIDFRHRNGGRSPTVGFRVACTEPGWRKPAAGTDDRLQAADAAVVLLPGHPIPHRARAEVLARQGRWADAAAARLRAWELAPNDHDDAYHAAILLALAGDDAGFRRHAHRMVQKFGGTRLTHIAERTAKACSLAPVADEDRAALLALADTAVQSPEPAWLTPFAQVARGMAAYRAGDYPAALEWLRKAQNGPQSLITRTTALAGFYEAMAYHRLGQSKDAQAALDRSTALVDRDLQQLKDGTVSGDPVDVFMAYAAHREATAMLRP